MSSHQHPYGKPENVLGFAEDSKVFVRDEPLRQMFLHPDVKHRKIVAFSIIGAYRKGKSFFLDYCLRYLYAHYPSINFPNNPVSNPNDWIGDEDEPLKGFSWHPGTIRVTTGLEVWNDVFLHTDETSGQEIAIFVMDTHGLFDKETSSLDNSRIFTLGTLISSIQVLNLSGVIQDDQLQYLQFATECAKSAITDNQVKAQKCFQNLTFLIRDWDNPDDYQYGFEGGSKYLANFMEVIGRNKKELKYVCESIYDSYENINCSLLTHPGKIVSRGKKGSQEYDGNWNGMDEDFKDELIILINFLLNPERLILKKINGNLLNGEDFLEFLLNQLKLFQTDELLKAQTLRDLMTEKEMEALVNSCIEYYKEVGNKNKSEIKTEEDIPALHEQCKNEALEKYDNSKKMGNEEDCTRFRKVLDDKIEQLFKELIIQLENDRKKLEDETEKLRSEMEERQKKKLEKIEKEKKMAEERLEVERKKAKEDLENEKKLKEQEIAELNKQNELERIAIEKRKEDERIATERTIEAIHEAVAESKQKYEDNKQKQQEILEEKEEQLKEDNESFGYPLMPEKATSDLSSPPLQNVYDDSVVNYKTSRNETIAPLIEVPTSNDDNVSLPSQLNEPNKRSPFEHFHKSNEDQVQNCFQQNQIILSANSDTVKLAQLDLKAKPVSSTTRQSKEQQHLQYPNENFLTKSKIPDQKQIQKENQINREELIESTSGAARTLSAKPARITTVLPNSPPENTKPKQQSLMKPTGSSGTTMKHLKSCEIVELISFPKHSKPFINEDVLKNTFEHPLVRDRKVVVFSVAGINRNDKNIFLDYCLKFLYSRYKSLKSSNNSLPHERDFSGFSSYFESNADASGIFMWNDVFLHTNDWTGEKIAIILMDTQGHFDYQSSSIDDSKIFALGTLISSIQVLNLTDDIQQNHLRYLNFATEVAKYATSTSQEMSERSFAHLVFLIREWNNNGKYSYGMDGGSKYVKDVFQTGLFKRMKAHVFANNTEKELKSIRERVHNSFEKISCLLLPGSNTINSNTSKFMMSNSEIIKKELANLLETFLSPKKLVPKTINGKFVTGRELYSYILSFYDRFQSDGTSLSQNVYDSSIELQVNGVVELCFNHYNEEMTKNNEFIKSIEGNTKLHDICKSKALNLFYELCEDYYYTDNNRTYESELERKIEESFMILKNSLK